jgi:hypothetical protein
MLAVYASHKDQINRRPRFTLSSTETTSAPAAHSSTLGRLCTRLMTGSCAQLSFACHPAACCCVAAWSREQSINDVFGFLVWEGSGAQTNIALLPNTNIPVSISNVNRGECGQHILPQQHAHPSRSACPASALQHISCRVDHSNAHQHSQCHSRAHLHF